ncbi:MAG: B12-binding domain-containing radical SAM protein [Vicinamibacterales bacterium]
MWTLKAATIGSPIRVLLINPPSPEQLGSPLLGMQYVAASLLRRGCDVKVIDAAARYFPHSLEWIVTEADGFDPHLIGFSLFTRWVFHAYELVARLRGRFPFLVAGGAHATVRPDETLEHGFDVAVVGEAEESILQIVDVIAGQRHLDQVRGICYRGPDNRVHAGEPAAFIADLDSLSMPLTAQELYDPHWYSPNGAEVTPGGILTSRGCPARCTFCANYVTGRGFRYRSAADVVAELNAYHLRTGQCFFPCWDDALTANIPRLYQLCEALSHDIRFPLQWSAITRANMVKPELLRVLKKAGLVHVNFGVESGDDGILRAIKKGLTTEDVVRALEWSKEEGLLTACNFMLGFPQETPLALERTLRFMERIAPLVDSFSTLGVLVPFPGTPLYDDYHAQYGFTDWWLREHCSRYTPPPPLSDFDRFYRHYIDDANLDLDFFQYSDDMRALMRSCMKFKAEHNLVRMGLLEDPVYHAGRPEVVAATADRIGSE